LYYEKLEIVNKYKILGVNVNKNGSWYRTHKTIAEHASKSVHRLFSIFNNYEFSMNKNACCLSF